MSRGSRISVTILLTVGLTLFVYGGLRAWGAALGAGFTYLDKEPPYLVRAYVEFAHVVFYGSVLGAFSQIAGLVLVSRRKSRPAAPNSAIEGDIPRAGGAPNRER